jgi:hypothetical protein
MELGAPDGPPSNPRSDDVHSPDLSKRYELRAIGQSLNDLGPPAVNRRRPGAHTILLGLAVIGLAAFATWLAAGGWPG